MVNINPFVYVFVKEGSGRSAFDSSYNDYCDDVLLMTIVFDRNLLYTLTYFWVIDGTRPIINLSVYRSAIGGKLNYCSISTLLAAVCASLGKLLFE